MFKAFQKGQQFKGFPALNFQLNNERFGFSACTFDLDARYNTNTLTNGAAISSWRDTIGYYNFSQATAGNQPSYNSTTLLLNNYPSIQFTNQRSLLGPQNFGFETVAFVFYNSSLNLQNVLLGTSDANNTSFSRINTGGTADPGPNGISYITSLTTVVAASFVNDTNPHIVVIGTNCFVIDGVTYTTPNRPVSFARISNTTNGGSFLGYVTRILGYKNPMNQDQAFQLCENINNEYAIY